MTKEQALKVSAALQRIEKLTHEKEEMENYRHLLTTTTRIQDREPTAAQKLDCVVAMMKRDKRLTEIFLTAFCDTMNNAISDKQKEIEEAEKELQSL